MSLTFIVFLITVNSLLQLATAQTNGSDTEKCALDQFKCTNNKCVPHSYRCDDDDDCGDLSDETNCNECTENWFKCASGECLPSSFVCDGEGDCEDDFSDEANCTDILSTSTTTTVKPVVTCASDDFTCLDGGCVPRRALCNSTEECSDGSDEFNCPGSLPTHTWKEHWHDHRENLSLVYTDDHVAVYFDPLTDHNITWPFEPLSQAWKYVKETYGPFGNYSRLYVILHSGAHNGCHMNSYLDNLHGHRNVIDCGRKNATNAWATNSTANVIDLLTSFGHIIRLGSHGILQNADSRICGEYMREILSYDVYNKIRGQNMDEIASWKLKKMNETENDRACFKDWWLPIYENHGGAAVLNEYYNLTATYLKRDRPSSGFHRLNMAFFILFWSAAAGTDLEPLAQKAFNWTNDEQMRLARARYPLLASKYSQNRTTTTATVLPASTNSHEENTTQVIAHVPEAITTTAPEIQIHHVPFNDEPHNDWEIILGIPAAVIVILAIIAAAIKYELFSKQLQRSETEQNSKLSISWIRNLLPTLRLPFFRHEQLLEDADNDNGIHEVVMSAV